MDEQSLLKRLLLFRLQALPSTICYATKHKLRLQRPLHRDVPLRGRLLVGQRVIVLEIAAEALGLESDPHGVLVHGGGVL